jgi:hypothetical protein
MFTQKWTNKLLETSRSRKSPDGDLVGRCWAPRGTQLWPNSDPWSDQNRPRGSIKGEAFSTRGVLRRFKTRVDGLRWMLILLKRCWTTLKWFKTTLAFFLDDFKTIVGNYGTCLKTTCHSKLKRRTRGTCFELLSVSTRDTAMGTLVRDHRTRHRYGHHRAGETDVL